MTQARVIDPMSFEAFLAWHPDDGRRYELIEGVVVEVLPTGPHEDVSGFLAAELSAEMRRRALPFSIPRTCVIKPHAEGSGYVPDVVILNRDLLKAEPLWPTTSVILSGATVPLAIEVVSPNWRDDYGHKLVEYEALGIMEYWLVDFRALGAVRYIGKPKQPTITICRLEGEEYQMQRFVAGETLVSGLFPQLGLTTDAVFAAAANR